jgi:hypothetical protein
MLGKQFFKQNTLCCLVSRDLLGKNHVKYYTQPAATHPIKEKNQTPAQSGPNVTAGFYRAAAK